jgi:hypothetical protein
MRGQVVGKPVVAGFGRFKWEASVQAFQGTQENGDANEQVVVIKSSMVYTADSGFGQMKGCMLN